MEREQEEIESESEYIAVRVKDILPCAGVEATIRDIAEQMEKQSEKEDIEGFIYYDIPEQYKTTGGEFPEKLQQYTYLECKRQGVSYPLVIAMIERESGYVYDRVGDDGNAIGYMQIIQRYYKQEMKEAGFTDLMNPYENISLGISIMSNLISKYSNEQDALAAYNYGTTGAKRNLWSKGIYSYEYNSTIMERKKQIEEILSK